MDRTLILRVAALYLPLVIVLLLGIGRRQPPRQFAACLLSLLWALPSLLVLQRLNQLAGWWSYASPGPLFRAIPLELYLGWAVLWGALPQLTFPRLALWRVATVMLAADLLAMPACAPVVVLGPHWLLGESVAVAIVLIPALCIARWTLTDTNLPLRSAAQIATSGLIFLFLLPELAFALRPGAGWQPLLQIASWKRQVLLQIIFLCAIPGVAAVVEFAQRGQGTPIPYDPPRKLVTSGIYRYVANPMQLSCAIVMLLWSVSLHNGWVAIAAIISIIYSAGIARWDEGADLAERFGQPWRAYRAAVHDWRPRWRPYHAGPPARLYIAATCGPCSEVRAWFEARHPLGLTIVDAETLPADSIRRIRYQSADSEYVTEGVRAVGRALEHLNLAWAVAGAALRLPLIWQFVQLMMDASGVGPRSLQPSFKRSAETSPRSS